MCFSSFPLLSPVAPARPPAHEEERAPSQPLRCTDGPRPGHQVCLPLQRQLPLPLRQLAHGVHPGERGAVRREGGAQGLTPSQLPTPLPSLQTPPVDSPETSLLSFFLQFDCFGWLCFHRVYSRRVSVSLQCCCSLVISLFCFVLLSGSSSVKVDNKVIVCLQ